MPLLNQSLNLVVSGTQDVQTGLTVAAAATQTPTTDLELLVVDTFELTVGLDSLLGPAYLVPLDLTVAEPSSLAVGLDSLLGPAAFATLDVRTAATGLERPVQLDSAVAQTQTLTAALDIPTAEPRSRTACLSPPVAESMSGYACLCVNVECPGQSQLRVLPADVLIAESRNACPLPMDVLVWTGVRADLNLVVRAEGSRFVALTANVRSDSLQVGASAVYNPDGDEVEVLLYVQDNGELYPEWIAAMTATLLYRGEHRLGTVAFDCDYATSDGDVQLLWLHPAHVDNLTVRFSGTVDNWGAVEFDVPVLTEPSVTTFTPQLLEGVDMVAPRTEYTPFGATTEVLDPAPEEIDVVDGAVVLTLFALDLISENEPIETGSGPLDYSGGGNRLLPSLNNDGTFVYQAAGQLPHGIDAYTVMESAGSNLLSNTNFATPTSGTDVVPAGYTLTASSTVTKLPELVEVGDVNALRIHTYGSGPYVGPKTLTFSSDTVGASAGQPVVWSVLTRLEYPERTALDIPLSVVKLDTLRMILSFRDASDLEISNQTVTFSPADVTGDSFVLLQNWVPVAPAGTVGVRGSVQLESIEESDNVYFWLMAPQVELTTTATSRMVGAGPVSRGADRLRLPQSGNLEFGRGAIQIDMAASYPATPQADACLFDSRTSGLNGFAAYHLANGKLRFVVAGPTGSVQLDTPDAYQFNPGVAHSVSVSWGSGLRSIWLDGNEVVSSSDPVVVPGLLGPWVYLAGDAAGGARFSGIVTAFEIQREPQG